MANTRWTVHAYCLDLPQVVVFVLFLQQGVLEIENLQNVHVEENDLHKHK